MQNGNQLGIPGVVVESSITDKSSITEAVIELSTGCVTTYRKKGKLYWRFSYRDGTTVRHRHIKGGCVGTPAADNRAEMISDAIACGCSRDEILETFD
jgi:hypothetical protein